MCRPDPPAILAIGEPGRAATEVPPGPPVTAGVPDIVLTPASTTRIEVRAASVRGVQHRATIEPRQDAFALQIAGDNEDELIAVVCDGVGSLPRSHEAAALVARRLAERGRHSGAWDVAFQEANDELGSQDDGTMATTALAVRVRADDEGWHGQVAWVGDSPLWHLSPDGDWSLCTQSAGAGDDGPLHDTSSAALPAPNLQVAELELDQRHGALFLMSDGVGNPLAWADEVRAALAGWWATPPDIFDFGRQVAFARRSHVDDRTVVGLWRRS